MLSARPVGRLTGVPPPAASSHRLKAGTWSVSLVYREVGRTTEHEWWRAAQRIDVDGGLTPPCTAHHRLQAAESARNAVGLKVVGQRARAQWTCDRGLSSAISGTLKGRDYVMWSVLGGVRMARRAQRWCILAFRHMLGTCATCT